MFSVMTVPVYASEGTATASSAARRESQLPTTLLARKYAGTAASDMRTALITLTAA